MLAAFTTCGESENYQDCEGLSDFSVMFLDKSFQNTLTYGYSASLPATETVYTVSSLRLLCHVPKRLLPCPVLNRFYSQSGFPGDKCNSDISYFGQCPMW